MRRIATVVLGIGVVAGLSVFGIAAPASAATLTVCAVGCSADNIQSAVDAATPGDTIVVAAGTYTQIVNINKAGLILQGAQAGVDARSRAATETIVSQGQFRLGADNITIDGFTFTGSLSAPATPAAAIYGSGFSGTQILNNIVEDGMFGAQFDNGGPEPALIRHNLFRDNDVNFPTGGTALFMLGTGSANVVIAENHFTGHPNAAINIVGSTVQVTGNTSSGDATLLVLTDSDDVDVVGNVVTDATTGSGIFLGLGNAGVTISDNVLESAATPGDNTAAIRISNAFGTGVSEDYTITGNEVTGGWSHAIRRSAGAYDGVLTAEGNQFGMVVTNEEPAPENAIDASGNWWDPSVDLTAMDNVVAAAPCDNVGCEAPPAAVLPATGTDAAVTLAAAGGSLMLGVLVLLGFRRRTVRRS